MDDESEISGGSSPFLDSPDTIQVQGKQSSSLLEKKDDIVPTVAREKVRELLNLEYKLSTLQNTYELEKLQAQRQFNDLEKKHRDTLEQLEGAMDNSRFLHDENEHVVNELDRLKSELQNTDNNKDSQMHDLELKLHERDKTIDDLKFKHESDISKFNYELESLRDEKGNVDELVQKYNAEIIRQAADIKKLSKELNSKEDEILELKNSNILNSHPNYNTEEFRDLSTMNKLFKEQAQYCKELEEINLKQANELKKYRNSEDSSSFWKNESEKLELKVQQFEYLEKKYEDGQVELLELKSKLTQYNMFTEELKGRDMFNIQPEEVINELDLLKKENLVVIDENSKLNINMSNVKILNEELALERTQLLNLNKDYENSIINLKRLNYELEQQKFLSFEECKLLRQQLQDLDNFTNNSMKGIETEKDNVDEKIAPPKIDNDSNNLIENYKNRTDELTGELKKLNQQMLASQEAEAQNFKKRKLKDTNGMTYYSQRINELQLENGKLTRDLQKYHNLNSLLETKLMKLINLKEKKIRILELRENPLMKDQFVKRKQLELLLQENKDLLAQLQSDINVKTIPVSVYESLNFDIKQQEQEIFKANKKFTRLKEVYNKKSLEFIEVVNSILGFKLEFRPDNKVKIYSCYMPKKYLVVDLKRNTLESNLAVDNWDELLEIWIEKRGQIPCFLATITLQLWNASHTISSNT
ncbi:similar to Saccharomyces cerevisiae YGL086W MAD1 Coiled-coil protein involved in the spindle- assembly checkpoint [Maudiozyma barnettii]|uniref:Spindle assembly checkpoint component MAD1 n=1 Tax=Maudiozyma barnettii TaxID=61262 RepID=A0A8H2VF11_9SACH|nr:coiled-coil domain-containing protein MAD1 [Kazachstania barnettii]CAB4254275.1 similar to Saccharomyces cerevisiae YGL086W MAD1 Coiled-coil protein involved in the spindle- assembly checkpoint [Kazachstania barnettii]CAD1782061.1 similar to Saccharomyces cerevisiae YGL086W MAD1 Coiled-coil protein involved in the spindle- assembly checkpoint [Kazachstania barnettii]